MYEGKRIVEVGLNETIFTGTASWANSAVANTAVALDIPLPSELNEFAKYLLVITNPSADSAINVSVQNKITLGGAVKYPEVKSLSVAANKPDGAATIIEGFLLGEAGRLVLSNPTAITAAGAFTAEIAVIKL